MATKKQKYVVLTPDGDGILLDSKKSLQEFLKDFVEEGDPTSIEVFEVKKEVYPEMTFEIN